MGEITFKHEFIIAKSIFIHPDLNFLAHSPLTKNLHKIHDSCDTGTKEFDVSMSMFFQFSTRIKQKSAKLFGPNYSIK